MSTKVSKEVHGLIAASEGFLKILEQVSANEDPEKTVRVLHELLTIHGVALRQARTAAMIRLADAGWSYTDIAAQVGLNIATTRTAIVEGLDPDVREQRRRRTQDEIVELLRERILDGTFPAGGRLPTTPRGAAMFDVSHPTYAKAVERLVDEGLVERRTGKRVPYVKG